MKKLMSRYLVLFVCVFSASFMVAKQVDLLDILFDGQEEVPISPAIKPYKAPEVINAQDSEAVGSVPLFINDQENNETVGSNPHIEELSSESPCSLLDLLFEDTQDITCLFPNKNEKYYRGQFKTMGLTYIDNSVCDESVPHSIKATRAIDQSKLTADEKAVVEKYYRLTKQQYESPWYMKFINKKIGYGIYAAADIEPGQLIAEYVGILYDADTYLSMPRNPKYCWNLNAPSLVKDGQKFYVDALTSCNFTRIINHSYKPNVIPVPMHGPDGSRMLYVACEKIEKDQQLLVNYGEGYWQTLGTPEDLSR